MWFASKLRVRISSNIPYDLGDNLAKNLDGHRSKRIKRSECCDKPRRSENLGQELKIGPSTAGSRDPLVIFAALRGRLTDSDTPAQDLGTTDHKNLGKISRPSIWKMAYCL